MMDSNSEYKLTSRYNYISHVLLICHVRHCTFVPNVIVFLSKHLASHLNISIKQWKIRRMLVNKIKDRTIQLTWTIFSLQSEEYMYFTYIDY